jgi:hypothetical protein
MPQPNGVNRTFILPKVTAGGTTGLLVIVNGRVVSYVAPT